MFFFKPLLLKTSSWTQITSIANAGTVVSSSNTGVNLLTGGASSAKSWTRSGDVWTGTAIPSSIGTISVDISDDGQYKSLGTSSYDARASTSTDWDWFYYSGMSGNTQLGTSISLNADGTYGVTGAPNATFTQGLEGAIVICARSGTTWPYQIHKTGTSYNERLGSSVSICGDGTKVVASGDSSLRLYTRSGTTWADTTSWSWPTGYGFTKCAIASNGRVIAGSSIVHSSYLGGFIVYRLVGSTWQQFGPYVTTTGGHSEGFGSSLSINSDGSLLLIGAPKYDYSGITNTGLVYLFAWSNTSYKQVATLSQSTPTAGSMFGTDVAISGDGKVIFGTTGSGTLCAFEYR